MASQWEHFGEIANAAQIAGVDAVSLIGMIVRAANNARLHKKNCRQFAQHLKLIGNLLKQLEVSEMKKFPETREPLEQLEDLLRQAYVLVNSCQDRSFLYLLAMGWNIVYQFRRAQNEIDRYLRLIPLITLVDSSRARYQERIEAIEKDQQEYTLDDEDREVQDVIMKPAPSKNDTVVLKKSLSTSYPNLPFNKALQKENEKLKLELQRSQAHLDMGQCQVIQHLIEVTETVSANSHPEKSSTTEGSKKMEHKCSDTSNEREHSCDTSYAKEGGHNIIPRRTSAASSGKDLISSKGSFQHEEWHSDLLDCCAEPSLCLKTLFCPCGTFSKIATVANSRHMSSAEACNDLMAYSLILSCCCYTCCVRRRLRKMFNITGGLIDDFLSHFLCCCCALVQEWREVEIRGTYGHEKTKTSPPPSQYMEY